MKNLLSSLKFAIGRDVCLDHPRGLVRLAIFLEANDSVNGAFKAVLVLYSVYPAFWNWVVSEF